MWPWEHLAVGYLVYSLLIRGTTGHSPTTGGTLAAVLGTQFPDLVDKPLAWGTGLLPGGQSLAHSLLFAIPVILTVLLVTTAIDDRRLGVAFGIGYLSHLPGDVVYPLVLGGELNLSFLLWPILPSSGTSSTAMLGYVTELFAEFAATLASPEGVVFLLAEATLILAALSVWILDGTPGLPFGRLNPRSGSQ